MVFTAFSQEGRPQERGRGGFQISLLVQELAIWDSINADGHHKPRLSRARGYFKDLKPELIPTLVDAYQGWVSFDEHIVIRGVNHKTGEKLNLGLKASKRGNDVYRRKTSARFKAFDSMTNARFFQDEDISRGQAFTPCLFFTLTYDSKRSSLDGAWIEIGLDFNRWRSRLEQKYGRVSVLRTWQDYESGYPHVHGVLLFKDARFKVAYKLEDPVLHGKTRVVYRIEGYEDFKESWHSFVDVSACYSVRGAVSYARRYITRGVVKGSDYRAPMQEGGSLSSQCLALNWLYRKRSFSVSGDFRSLLSEFINAKRNSKGEMMQSTLDIGHIHTDEYGILGLGPKLLSLDPWEWTFLGVYYLGSKSKADFVSLSEDELDGLMKYGKIETFS